MTIFAGVIALQEDSCIPDDLCGALSNVVSRDPDAVVQEYRGQTYFIAHVDVGAFGSPGRHIEDDGAITLIAGDPILDVDGGSPPSRAASARLLHVAWRRRDPEIMTTARAPYCAVHVDPGRGRAALLADKIALRPIYYWENNHVIVFATALRILEHCPLVPKVMDLGAMSEIACFGFALSDRTPYVGIKRLRAGEILDVSAGTSRRSRYWRWDRTRTSQQPVRELQVDAYGIFEDAVRLRLGNERTTVAFLSGGLDTRCNVALLRKLGATVHSFDYSMANSQDAVFSSLFAQAVGSVHASCLAEEPTGPRRELYSFAMARHSAALMGRLRGVPPPERPSLPWSGDGGSFTVGFVQLSQKLFDLARAEGTEAAIDEQVRTTGSLAGCRLMKPSAARLSAARPRSALREELAWIDSDDPAKNFYILHLVTASSRFLHRHLESLDLHKLEMRTPFWDAKLVEHMLTVPMDHGIGHKFYHNWLRLFPPSTTTVPWQTYPGHEPCPLPIPADVPAQWDLATTGAVKTRLRKRILLDGVGMVLSKHWPGQILKKLKFTLYVLAHFLRHGDYGYIVRTARLYVEHSAVSEGRYSVRPSDGHRQDPPTTGPGQ
jgi:hypothetical protein